MSTSRGAISNWNAEKCYAKSHTFDDREEIGDLGLNRFVMLNALILFDIESSSSSSSTIKVSHIINCSVIKLENYFQQWWSLVR